MRSGSGNAAHPWQSDPDLPRELFCTLLLASSLWIFPVFAHQLFPALKQGYVFFLCTLVGCSAYALLSAPEIGLRKPAAADWIIPPFFALLLMIAGGVLGGWWQEFLRGQGIVFTERQELLSKLSGLGCGDFPATVFSVCILSPLAEELLFRRLIFGRLCRVLSSGAAAVLTAALFSAVHLFLAGAPALFLLGIGFQLIYCVRKNLTAAILTHIWGNLAAVFLQLLCN